MKNQHNTVVKDYVNDKQIELINHGYETLGTFWHWGDARMPYNRLYFIPRGSSGWLHDAANGKLYMKPGHIYLVPHNHRFAYGTDGEFDQIWFHFRFHTKYAFDAFERFGKIAELKATTEVEQMDHFYGNDDSASALMIKAIIHKAVAEIAMKYDYDLRGEAEYSTVVACAVKYIMAHLSPDLTVDEIADACDASKSSLTKHFNSELGLPVKTYVMNLLVDEAKIRLNNTGARISDVARDLGFSDQYVFSRSFKLYTGLSPRDFRQKGKANE